MGEPRSPWLLRYMFPQLPLPLPARAPARKLTEEEERWSLRGETRTRKTFAAPHPGDFKGGLPLPGEYPTLSGLLSDSPCGTHPKYIA